MGEAERARRDHRPVGRLRHRAERREVAVDEAVSNAPARKPSASRSRLRKAAFVFGPATTVSPSAPARRSRASSRVAAWAITLAIIGS